MDAHGKSTHKHQPEPTEAEKKAALVQIELEYNMQTSQLVIRSKCPTIFVEGILLDAVKAADTVKGAPTPPDGRIVVTVDYNMIHDRLLLTTNAPRVVTKGVIAHALGGVTRNQVAQNFQVYKQDVNKRFEPLEVDLNKRKIILAGG